MPGLYRSAQKKRKQVISILGMTEESEATRLALAIANYYASVQRRVTGYGEIAKATKLGYMLEESRCVPGNVVGFRDGYLLYYPQLGKQEIGKLMEEDWERLILDQTMEKDCEILIGSGAMHLLMVDPAPWRYRQIQLGMRTLLANQQLYRLLKGNAYTYTDDKRAISHFREEFGIVLHRIPRICDPYCLQKKDIKAIRQILAREELL
jgi:hypothetical protein